MNWFKIQSLSDLFTWTGLNCPFQWTDSELEHLVHQLNIDVIYYYI